VQEKVKVLMNGKEWEIPMGHVAQKYACGPLEK
jgi:hypothetical protein